MATQHDAMRAEREPLIANPNDPNRLSKEEAIRHKIRTYEAILALKSGYTPSTDQYLQWVRYALQNSAVLDSRNRRLSSPGRQFVRDLRSWLEAVGDAAEQKNGDNKIQEFLYHTSKAEVAARLPDVGGAGPRIGSTSDVQQLYSRLRLLGGLLYSSPEFRKMISDFSVIGRDIFADAASSTASYASKAADKASKAAEQARPSEDDLARVDEPAETFQSREEAEEAADSLQSGREHKKLPSKGELKRQVQERARGYTDETRKRTYKAGDDLQEYLKQKFPKQRRDAVVNRLKKVIADIQQNPDFQETAEFVIQLVSDYVNRLRDTVVQEGKKVGRETNVHYDEHFEIALERGKEIITAFAGGKSPDNVRDALSVVIKDVESDPDLHGFYSDFTNFLKRMLTEPNFATSDQADAEAHEYYDRSKELLETKTDAYRPHVEHLFNEINVFITAIQKDRTNRRVVEASKKVFNDLVIEDRYGNYRFRTRVARDLLDVMLPKLISEIKYVPLPRIEYQDRDYDVILENVVLESEHFLPHRLLFEAHTRADYTNQYNFASHYSGYTRMHISNMNLFIRDASFVIRKKTGLIPFSDRGFLDLFLDASADIVLDKANYDEYFDDDADAESYFHVRSVKVQVHKFRYNYNAYHSWAATLMSPVIKPIIRKLLARMMEDKIREGFEAADKELHALAERVRVATIANKGGGSMEAWVRAVLSRPGSGERRRGLHTSAGERGLRIGQGGRNGFAVTIGAEEELFPGEHGPGAVLSKFGTAEERVLTSGEVGGGWRNDIFDVRG